MAKRFGRNARRKLLDRVAIAEEEKRCAMIRSARAESNLDMLRKPQQFVSVALNIEPNFGPYYALPPKTHIIKTDIKLNPVTICHDIDLRKDSYIDVRGRLLEYVMEEYAHMVDHDLKQMWAAAGGVLD